MSFVVALTQKRRSSVATSLSGVGVVGILCGVVVVGTVALALAAPILPIRSPSSLDLTHTFAGPSAAHLLGTDGLGEDLLSRLIWGSRTALGGAFAVAVGSTLLGALFGITAAWKGGVIDSIVARALDILFAFPGILLALMAVAVFGDGLRAVVVAVALAYSPFVARSARAASNQELGKPYIAAARVLGVSPWAICWRHVAINISGVLVAQTLVNFGYALVDLSALSYLGFGVSPSTADWGVMVAAGQPDILQGHPQEALYAGLAIVIVVLVLTVFGDRLQRSDRRF